MEDGIEFFTSTCLNWQNLLEPEEHKKIILQSLEFLVSNRRIWLYGFVIMPNHIHLMWRKQEEWRQKNIQQQFLKFTAQQIKFRLQDSGNHEELNKYKSSQQDRMYHFWERRAYKATMYNRKVATQKIDYMHRNPVKAKLCEFPEQYIYSSAAFYILNKNEWGFITHYEDHL